MNSVAILQARTNSSRLPGKVLLPINGLSLVVLAAMRAGNTGRQVVVATSTELTDDALAAVVAQHGIRCYRGSLDNPLERIVAALDGYDDTTLVFRLTADNVFPDGSLLDEMEQDFIERKLDYLCCNGEPSGLPYGLSAELTLLGHLREAVVCAQSSFDQEHVTPYIKRRFGQTYFKKYKALGKGHYRCTVDCLDDYLGIRKIFSTIEDAVQIPAFDLIPRLDDIPYQPMRSKPAKKLVLGTAQLGLNYGIANQHGKPKPKIASQLIKTAVANGVRYIDTARAYGTSENAIGSVLESGWEGRAAIITKLSPLEDCPPNASPAVVNAFVDASLYQSRSALRVSRLAILLLHRASHMHDWDGAVWSRLLEQKENGTLKALGVSIQNPEELEWALASQDVSFIQMPFNVLDWRWDDLIPTLRAVKQKRELTILVRSALLQGLLPSTRTDYWRRANVQLPEVVINWLAAQSQFAGSDSVAEFCLRVAKSCDWVDGVVVGMETMDQLVANVEAFSTSDFSDHELNAIIGSRPKLNEYSLNPSCWS